MVQPFKDNSQKTPLGLLKEYGYYDFHISIRSKKVFLDSIKQFIEALKDSTDSADEEKALCEKVAKAIGSYKRKCTQNIDFNEVSFLEILQQELPTEQDQVNPNNQNSGKEDQNILEKLYQLDY